MRQKHPADKILSYLDRNDQLEKDLAVIAADPDFQALSRMDTAQLAAMVSRTGGQATSSHKMPLAHKVTDGGFGSHKWTNVGVASAASILLMLTQIYLFSILREVKVDHLVLNEIKERIVVVEKQFQSEESELRDLMAKITSLENNRREGASERPSSLWSTNAFMASYGIVGIPFNSDWALLDATKQSFANRCLFSGGLPAGVNLWPTGQLCNYDRTGVVGTEYLFRFGGSVIKAQGEATPSSSRNRRISAQKNLKRPTNLEREPKTSANIGEGTIPPVLPSAASYPARYTSQ